MTLLKSCGAFEPFRRQPARAAAAPAPVAEYLLLDPQFPRAVLFCLERARARRGRGGAAGARARTRLDAPARLLGRLRADLATSTCREVLQAGLSPLLEDLLRRVHQVGDEVTRTYFNTRVILPAPPRRPPARSSSSSNSSRGRAREAAHHAHHDLPYDEPVSEAYMEMRLHAARRRRPALRVLPPRHRSRRARCAATWTASATASATSTPSHPHDRLVVSARSEVSTPEAFVDPRAGAVACSTPSTTCSRRAYAPDSEADPRRSRAACARARRRAGDRAARCWRAVHEALAYTPGATTVKTTADEALGARARRVPGLRPPDDRRLPRRWACPRAT